MTEGFVEKFKTDFRGQLFVLRLASPVSSITTPSVAYQTPRTEWIPLTLERKNVYANGENPRLVLAQQAPCPPINAALSTIYIPISTAL